MTISRVLIGTLSIFIGIISIFSFFIWNSFGSIFWGGLIFIFGIIVLLNKKEDVIEQINYKKMKGGKK